MKILILEDDKEYTEILEYMFKGSNVKIVAKGEEVIELYKLEKFDILILDLTVIDGMGGVDTLKELLKIDPSTKAIASSGNCSEGILEHGFKSYIQKPFRKEEIFNKVQEVYTTQVSCFPT